LFGASSFWQEQASAIAIIGKHTFLNFMVLHFNLGLQDAWNRNGFGLGSYRYAVWVDVISICVGG
jgi:hypothetical protein